MDKFFFWCNCLTCSIHFYKLKYVLFKCRSRVNISVNHIRVEIYKTFRGKLNNGICNKIGKKYAIKHLQKMC